MAQKQPAGCLRSILGVEYDAHWTSCLLTEVCQKQALIETHRWAYANHRQILWDLPHKPKSSLLRDAIWAFEYQTKHVNDDRFPGNNSHREQPCYEKLHCLLSFNHFNFDLDPKSFINLSRWLSMLQSSSNGLHLALGMWDPFNCNLAETYFSKQGKVAVISFIQ